MEHRRLGRTGLSLPAISIGGWLTLGDRLDARASRAVLDAAFDGGVTHVDLADAYADGEAERIVGEVLADRRRETFVISSKVFWPTGDGPNDRGLSRKHIRDSVHASLRRLRTDYLDLYYCHREDPNTPLEETARAMDDLVRQGKVLYWGTSLFRPSTLVRASASAFVRGRAAPAVEQPPYNLLDRHIEKRLLPTARALGMGVVVFSPLAGGALTGKYDRETPPGSRGATTEWLDGALAPENRARLRHFSTLAAEAGFSPSELALAWVLRRQEITSVIIGASSPAQVTANLRAVGRRVPADVCSALDALFPVGAAPTPT